MNRFKDVHEYKVGISKRGIDILGKHFKAGSIVVIDSYHSSFGASQDVYICDELPKTYAGNNPILNIWEYNEHYNEWQRQCTRNNISRMIWREFVKRGRRRPTADKFYLSDDNARSMMKVEVKKKRSGTRVGSAAMTSELRYKQITEYAYLANLDDVRSGNASVVASNIYR